MVELADTRDFDELNLVIFCSTKRTNGMSAQGEILGVEDG